MLSAFISREVAMLQARIPILAFGVVILLATGSSAMANEPAATKAADKKSSVKSSAEKLAPKEGATVTVSGLLIDRPDTWASISVLADGEEEEVKYLFDKSPESRVLNDVKQVFTVSRVKLTYNLNGDARELLSINMLPRKPRGSVTGTFVRNYGWWISVKPKNGAPDGYALHFRRDQPKEILELLKVLQPGDIVTINYTSDFERHRIDTLKKIGTAKK
jgi:hypothetical protein